MTENNIILMTDSYKPSHSRLYKPGTTYMQSYFESRSDSEKIRFFGLQYLLKEYLEGVRVTPQQVIDARDFFKEHYGRDDVFDYYGWMYIAKKLNGKLPIRIYAIPEGTVADSRTPLIVVESTDEKVFWVVNYLETLLSQVWYPTTVATNSYNARELIASYLRKTSDLEGEAFDAVLNFRLHDFGYRGVASVEQAGIGGLAHLTSFWGTDTIRAIEFAKKYYNETGMPAFSIPATEHSTMTTWGGEAGEVDAMENLLDTYPDGTIACVSDSYDIIRAINEKWGGELKEKIMARNGTLVIRPDSGCPVVSTERVFYNMWHEFGGEVNSKGYKVLDDKVRIIQGDGIDREMIVKILSNFEADRISTENIAFGSGGGLLQKFDRDTHKFAFKCNLVITDGKEVDVRKSPMEFDREGHYSRSFKSSKAGDLTKSPGLEVVFENGEIVRETTLSEVRGRE